MPSRTVIALLLAAMSLCSLSIGRTNADTNLLENPSFTQGESHWTCPKAVYSIDNNCGRTDNSSLHCRLKEGSPYLLAVQNLPTSPGKCYLYSAWIKMKDVKGQTRICIQWNGSNGYMAGSYIESGLSGTSDWQRVFFVSQRIPEGAIGLEMVLYADPQTTGDIWFDDVSLVELKEPLLAVDYPDPVWRGRTVLAASDSSCVKIRASIAYPSDDDLEVGAGDLAVKASLTPYRDSVASEAAPVDWKGGQVEMSVPAGRIPLGTSTLCVQVIDKQTGRVIAKSEEEIKKIEWIRLDIASPNCMGVVGTKVGEKPSLTCRVQAQVPPGAQPELYDVVLSLLSKGVEVREIPKVVRKIRAGTPALIDFSVAGLPLGTYDLQASLRRPGTADTLASVKRMVTKVDPKTRPSNATDVLTNGMLMVDGKLTMPIGIYMLSSLESIPPVGKPWNYSWEHKNRDYYLSCLDLLEKSPIKCLIDYGTAAGSLDETKTFLDEAHKRGLKVIFSVKDDVLNAQNAKLALDDPDIVGKHLQFAKEHPSVFAVYHNDETFETERWPYIESAYRLVREIDPWHPTYSVQFMYMNSLAYAKATDAYGTDPYCLLDNTTLAAESWRIARNATSPEQPMWAVVQTFGGAYESGDPNADTREPSYDEMRSGTYAALAEGATGIIYYDLHAMQRSPEFPRRWRELCSIADEVQKLTPIVALPAASKPVKAIKGNVSILTKQGDGKLYVFLVNTQRNRQTVTLKWPVRTEGVRDSLTARMIAADDGASDVEMAPLGVCLLEADIR